MSWLRRLWEGIASIFSNTGKAVADAFTGYQTIADSFVSIETSINEIDANVQVLIRQLRAFQFNPQWKTRVINVPDAIDAVRELIDKVVNDSKDRFEKLRKPVSTFASAMQSLQQPDPPGNPGENNDAIDKTILVIATIKQMATDLSGAFEAIKDFEALALELINDIETLDPIFLPQGSTKTTVTEHYRKRSVA